MKVRKRVRSVKLVDVGSLVHTLRLPTATRLKREQRTVCDHCGKPITDEYFIAGWAEDSQGMMFHEACVPDEEKREASK